MLSFFPRGVLDEILNLIESVSEGFSFLLLNIQTPNNINFPFGTNGKFMTLSVPILKHFRLYLVS